MDSSIILLFLISSFVILSVLGAPFNEFSHPDSSLIIRVYTEGSTTADDDDCFVGTCNSDTTLTYDIRDLCEKVDSFTADPDGIFDMTDGGDDDEDPAILNIKVTSLLSTFYDDTRRCDLLFIEAYEDDNFIQFTSNWDRLVIINFVDRDVALTNGATTICDQSLCDNHPNGIIRANFIVNSFCNSDCAQTPSPSPSPSLLPSESPTISRTRTASLSRNQRPPSPTPLGGNGSDGVGNGTPPGQAPSVQLPSIPAVAVPTVLRESSSSAFIPCAFTLIASLVSVFVLL